MKIIIANKIEATVDFSLEQMEKLTKGESFDFSCDGMEINSDHIEIM